MMWATSVTRSLCRAAAAVVCLSSAALAQAPADAGSKPSSLVIGETFTIRSETLGETRRINVYAPPGHADSSEVRLPVLYMPDGGIGEDFLHVAGLIQVSVSNGTMRPFLLVGIENTLRRRDLTGPTVNPRDKAIASQVGGSAAFRRFIRSELMPLVNARYRTTGETAIVGESLAGLFVVETFFLEPDLFDTYVAFDPSLWWNNGQLVDGAVERLRAGGDRRRTLYLASSSEPELAKLANRLAGVLRRHADARLSWHYDAMPGETHATIYHPAALVAFRHLFKAAEDTSRFDSQTIASRLETPWSLAFAPDGRLFVTERAGRIRVIGHDSLAAEPWAVLAVHESVARGLETGLMGLAIDPAFARNRRVYVCHTHAADDGALSNRIVVLTEENGRGVRPTVLVGGIPAGSYHNGCRLKFGPDGNLYATTGDAAGNPAEAGAAQSTASLAGKVLRLNPDGSVPGDNPFPGSYVWSYGHRNPQGLAFQPRTGRLIATEHGTGGSGNNELNMIERGHNYGWPTVIGAAADPRFTAPIFVGENAPAGATFVTSERFPALRGSLLVATLSAERLLQFEFGPGEPLRVVRSGVLIDKKYGRLRDVIEGPDGYLYIATSNRDGRGKPTSEDDRVIRLLPHH